MFEASLDKLGQFPILQFFGGLLILMGVAFAIMRGERDKNRGTPNPEPQEARWFFDGPLLKALEALQNIYRELKELRSDNEKIERLRTDHHREFLDVMRDLDLTRRRRK